MSLPTSGTVVVPVERRVPKAPHWGALLLVWTLAGLMSLVSGYVQYRHEGLPVPWSRLWSEVAGWGMWILLFPVMVWAVRRYPLGRRSWRSGLPAHLLIGAAVATTYAVLAVFESQVALALASGTWTFDIWGALGGYLFGGFQTYFLVYWLLVAGLHAIDYYHRFREREVRSIELEAELHRTQLQLLKLQLDPHFLFNALNAVAALVHSDPDGAERMVGLLSDFLRQSLHNASRPEVTLREELEFLALYLEIEQTRFGDRLHVEVDVPAELLSARVPTMILQPLVENAIRHGRRPGGEPLRVRVLGRPHADGVELCVRDDGRGLSDHRTEGVGVLNTRARLRQLYGGAQVFTLSSATGGGAEARVLLPWRGEDRPPLAEGILKTAPASGAGS